jgi:hypothetical protein
MLRTERLSNAQTKMIAGGFAVLVEVLKALGTPEGSNRSAVLPADVDVQ